MKKFYFTLLILVNIFFGVLISKDIAIATITMQGDNIIFGPGNIGIGTTNPKGILDILGNYHFPNDDGVWGDVMMTNGSGDVGWGPLNLLESDPQVSITELNYVPKWTGMTLQKGTIYDDGNVGIGTTGPRGILDIAGEYHFPSVDGAFDQVLITDGSGNLSWAAASDNDWTEQTSPANHIKAKAGGIATNGATLYGSLAHTHINLGFGSSVTGTDGINYQYATIGGGLNNTASKTYSTVGGGWDNTASVSETTVSGGSGNTASGQCSTVGGGNLNTASGYSSTVVGGRNNTAGGSYSWAGGRYMQLTDSADHTFAWGYSESAQSISTANAFLIFPAGTAGNVGIGTTDPKGILDIAGEYHFPSVDGSPNDVLQTNGSGSLSWAAVSDSDWTEQTSPANHIKAKAGGIATNGATLYGPNANTHINLGFGSSVTGTSGEDYQHATVGGGQNNTAIHSHSTVGGGANNMASAQFSGVGVGFDNTASGSRSTVGGGEKNTASGSLSIVGGGQNNTASQSLSIVGGGYNNTASGSYSTVGGGYDNIASGLGSAVAGGEKNTASAQFSTVGGGYGNIAEGDHSWAGGKSMQLTDSADHTFVWGHSDGPQSISTPNAFLIFPAGTLGNVGIGLTDPITALDINGTATATAFVGDGSGLTNVTATVISKSGVNYFDSSSPSYSLSTDLGYRPKKVTICISSGSNVFSKAEWIDDDQDGSSGTLIMIYPDHNGCMKNMSLSGTNRIGMLVTGAYDAERYVIAVFNNSINIIKDEPLGSPSIGSNLTIAWWVE
ncbi:MAG: hypothetical protein GY864_01315 [Desulfobacterales bacterium]|nr:hypothetical protein [Desulfobacterales bacterium]